MKDSNRFSKILKTEQIMAVTKENAKDFLPFIKALSEGKKIEYKDYKDGKCHKNI